MREVFSHSRPAGTPPAPLWPKCGNGEGSDLDKSALPTNRLAGGVLLAWLVTLPCLLGMELARDLAAMQGYEKPGCD